MVQVTEVPHEIVRLKFSKIGSLQYISHLDLVRTVGKIVVRAKLPLWYTEGFNPKPKMTFSPPLSIGVESETEYLDLRVTEHIDPALIIERINANSTDELFLTDAYYPTTKLSQLAYFSYEFVIHAIGMDEKTAQRCKETLLQPEIPVEKKGKAGLHTVNISPLIRDLSTEMRDGELLIRATLRSDGTAFLNPDTVLFVLKRECGILTSEVLTEEWTHVCRKNAFFEDMTLFR